ncbi:gamma-glutamyl-gamma-aminobutyrate hydrolase family protein [Ammonifex thiophilus]|uniref:Gamma-glutamyl-gamma-aminobutyrate hydrolase family protein n=1 Tax=Ammonifex thiophilus TaxID=444093 RepID=A0A3D8P7E5_9THEO|nr:gamma-glutamyl-gamma-aminobutyrate hydrolase family protein [Ammonifex thiophilus]RDV84345.1 gamma-glutamyl-gamma-aminobutyrate hydrolase family protein [Ammonifex thiophilus]
MPVPIGITVGLDQDESRYLSPRAYAEAVSRAGGLPLLLPPLPPGEVPAVLRLVRGIVLSGGNDLDPVYFGEECLPLTRRIEPERDAFELALARLALHRRVPLLGICRGMQVLNVAAGGSLYQDLSLGIPNPLKHFQEAPRWYASHWVELLPGSRLARIMGGVTRLKTNSFHHQAVRQVAPGFKAVAWTSDGVVEAIEAEGEAFALGVQFHPETMIYKEPLFLRLFVALVQAAGGIEP